MTRKYGWALALHLAITLAGVVTVANWPAQYLRMTQVNSTEVVVEPLKVRMQDGNTAVTRLIVEGIMPGDAYVRRFRVDGPEGLRFLLTLRTKNIRDQENGCSVDERPVDLTCGSEDGEGELSAAATLTAIAVSVPQRQPCDFAASATMFQAQSLRALDVATPSNAVRVDPHEDACVEIRLALPADAGNETQSDGTIYDLVWRAEAFHASG